MMVQISVPPGPKNTSSAVTAEEKKKITVRHAIAIFIPPPHQPSAL